MSPPNVFVSENRNCDPVARQYAVSERDTPHRDQNYSNALS
jgi:hypothetical protein